MSKDDHFSKSPYAIPKVICVEAMRFFSIYLLENMLLYASFLYCWVQQPFSLLSLTIR